MVNSDQYWEKPRVGLKAAIWQFLRSRVKRWTRAGVYEFISESLAGLQSGDRLLVVGGQGPILELVKEQFPHLEVTTFDIEPDHEPDVLGDFSLASNLDSLQSRFNAVLLSEVLEHIPDYGTAVANALGVLVSDGLLVATTPWITPLHDQPHDYHRFSYYEIRRVVMNAGFFELKVECRGTLIDSWLALGLRGLFRGDTAGRILAIVCVVLTFFLPLPRRLVEIQDSTIGYNFLACKGPGPAGARNMGKSVI